MATKIGRMIAFSDELLPIMLHDPLITWPYEIRGSGKLLQEIYFTNLQN